MKDSCIDAVVREGNVEAETYGQGREKPMHIKGREQVVVLFFYESNLNCKEYTSKKLRNQLKLSLHM